MTIRQLIRKEKSKSILFWVTLVFALSPVILFSILVFLFGENEAKADIFGWPISSYLIACSRMWQITIIFFCLFYLVAYLFIIRTVLKTRFSFLTQVSLFIVNWTISVFPGTLYSWGFYDQEGYGFWAGISSIISFSVFFIISKIYNAFTKRENEIDE